MKKAICAVFLTALLASCGTDNSSSVQFTVDGNGCLVQADGFDWTEESETPTSRTVIYRWECATYDSPVTGESFGDARVTLIFSGGACLALTSEIVGEGFCTDTKLKIN